MNPNRTYEENMAALKKVLTQRTYPVYTKQ